MLYRVVLDTKVLVSAIVFGGNCEVILRWIQSGRIAGVVSEAIQRELIGVLREKFNFTQKYCDRGMRQLTSFMVVKPETTITVIKQDEPDNRILECAVTGRVQYIISGDTKHLLPLKEYQGISIISPSNFVQLASETICRGINID